MAKKLDVDQLQETYGTLCSVAKKLDVDPKVIYDVCSCKQKLLSQATQKVMPKEMQTMRDVWRDSSVTTDMPHKKHAGKHFLIVTLLDTYHQYEKLAKQRDQRVLSYATFKKHRPKKLVKLRKCLPDMTCQCDICLNLGLKTKALIAVGVKGLSQSITSNLRQTLCAVPGKEKEKMDMSEFNLSCMTRKCPYCGVHHLREILHELNPDLQEEEDDRLVVYHAWERKEMEFHIVNHKVRHQKPDGVDSVPVKRKILD